MWWRMWASRIPRDGRSTDRRVVVVGAASRDVVDDDPRGWRLGGAVTFARWPWPASGFEVRALVGADAEAAAASELDLLRSAGVAVALAALASRPGVRQRHGHVAPVDLRAGSR